jgi:hypothetical protein
LVRDGEIVVAARRNGLPERNTMRVPIQAAAAFMKVESLAIALHAFYDKLLVKFEIAGDVPVVLPKSDHPS